MRIARNEIDGEERSAQTKTGLRVVEPDPAGAFRLRTYLIGRYSSGTILHFMQENPYRAVDLTLLR